MWSDGYVSAMSVQEWVTVALLGPLMIGWLALAVTLTVGVLRSRARRRQAASLAAETPNPEPDQGQEAPPELKT